VSDLFLDHYSDNATNGISTSYELQVPVNDIRAYVHTIEDGEALIPTSAMYRNLLGLSSPWFATYASSGNGVRLDPSTGVPIYNMSDQLHMPGIDNNGFMIPIGFKVFDGLLCPANPTMAAIGGLNLSTLGKAYISFLNRMQDVQHAAIPALALKTGTLRLTDDDFNLATMCEWSVAASSVPMASGGKIAGICCDVRVASFAPPYGNEQNNLTLRVSEVPEIYGPTLMNHTDYNYSTNQIQPESVSTSLHKVTILDTSIGSCTSNVEISCQNINDSLNGRSLMLLEDSVSNIFSLAGNDSATYHVECYTASPEMAIHSGVSLWALDHIEINGSLSTSSFPVLFRENDTGINIGAAPITIMFERSAMPSGGNPNNFYVRCTVYPLVLTAGNNVIAKVESGSISGFAVQPPITNPTTLTTVPPNATVPVPGSTDFSGSGTTTVPKITTTGASNYFTVVVPTSISSTSFVTAMITTSTQHEIIIKSITGGVSTVVCQLTINRPVAANYLYLNAGDVNGITYTVETPIIPPTATVIAPLFSVDQMRPTGPLADAVDEICHNSGPWSETAASMRSAEQFWQKMPSLPIPLYMWAAGNNLRAMPDIDPHRWIVIKYDLYGIPDESQMTSANRRPATDIDLSDVPIGDGVYYVGLSMEAQRNLPYGSRELQMTVSDDGTDSNGYAKSAIDVTANFRPISGWGKQSGNAENLSVGTDSRRKIVDQVRSTYEPWTMMNSGIAMGNRVVTCNHAYEDSVYDENLNMYAGVYTHVGKNSRSYNADGSQTVSTIVTGDQGLAVIPGADTIDLTIGSSPPLAVNDGKLVARVTNADISSGRHTESKFAYVPNRIAKIDISTNIVELEFPVPCIYGEIQDDVIIERVRYVNRIHASKLANIYSAGCRFYGSVSGADMTVIRDGKLLHVHSVGNGQYARKMAKIECRPGCGIIASMRFVPNDEGTFFEDHVAGNLEPSDGLNRLSTLPSTTNVCAIAHGSSIARGEIFSIGNLGISRTSALALATTGSPAIISAFDLTTCVTGDNGKNVLSWNDFAMTISDGLVDLLSATPASLPWNAVSVLCYIDMPHSSRIYFRRVQPNVFARCDSPNGPSAPSSFDVIIPSNAIAGSGNVEIIAPINYRPTLPFQIGASDAMPVLNVSGSGAISSLTVTLHYNGVSVELAVSNDQGNCSLAGFAFDGESFTYDGQYIAYPPMFQVGSGPASSISANGLYYDVATSTFEIVVDGIITFIPKHVTTMSTWNSDIATADFLCDDLVYVNTGKIVTHNIVTRASETSWSLPVHFCGAVTSAAIYDGTIAATAILNASESFGISQMRFENVYTDPRTAAACMRTTKFPLQLAGPLGNVAEHWSARIGPGCAANHPYFSTGCIRYSSPEIVTLPTTYGVLNNVAVTDIAMAWDAKVMKTIRDCDYLAFRSLVRGNSQMFTTRFLTLPMKYAMPVFDAISGTYECPVVTYLLSDGSLDSSGTTYNPGPSMTLICNWLLALQNLANKYSKEAALAFMQIFEDSVRLVDSPGMVAVFLSIAANTKYPGSATKTYIDIPAPDGFAMKIRKYTTTTNATITMASTAMSNGSSTNNVATTVTSNMHGESLASSLLSALELIAVGHFIDTFDDTCAGDTTWTFNGVTYDLTNVTATSSTSKTFVGTVERDTTFVSSNIFAGNAGATFNFTTLPTLPPISQTAGAVDILSNNSTAPYVHYDDLVKCRKYLTDLSAYMCKLLGRISMRGSVGGIPSTAIKSSSGGNGDIEFTSSWRTATNAPWDIAWVYESSAATSAIPTFMPSVVDGSGYIGSVEYRAIPGNSMMTGAVSPIALNNSAGSGSVSLVVSTMILKINIDGYIVLSDSAGNRTSTTTVAVKSLINNVVTVTVPTEVNSSSATPETTPVTERFINLMEIIPASDLYVYAPQLLSTTNSTILTPYGLGFVAGEISPTNICAFWSPWNLAPYATVIPCIANLRTSMVDDQQIQSFLTMVLKYQPTP
jgi:hypothetical protein